MIAEVHYTNPFSEWLWESGAMFWIIVGAFSLIAGSLLVVGICTLYERWKKHKHK